MNRVFFVIPAVIYIILSFNFVESQVQFNETELFQRFKENYNRIYSDQESEREGFNNFVNNLAEVNRLNKEHPGQVIAYQLNRFADQNPEDINERFGIQMKPCK